METFYEEEDNQEEDELQKKFSNSLWGNSGNPWHPEYEGDFNDLNKERAKFRKASLTPWDRLLTREEVREIPKLGIDLDVHCPYLQLARGSEMFYFCQALADQYVRKGREGKISYVKFTGAVASWDSAENYAHCTLEELGNHCIGENFKLCQQFRINAKKTNLPFSKEND
jgi:hypothetical protein